LEISDGKATDRTASTSQPKDIVCLPLNYFLR
jgi:hypothetical protein